MTAERVREVAAGILDWELSVGYASRAHLIDLVGDALADEGLEPGDPFVEQLVDSALAQRRLDEETWREPTDHDRLVAAFDALDQSGIVARECYGATIRDAEQTVRHEAERVAAVAPVRGTCTFNVQDAEGAASGGLLFLSYASFGGDDHASIGEEIRAALHGHGLVVEWSGQPCARIGVRIPDWRVRRSTGDRPRRTMRGCSEIWSADD